MDAGFNPWLWIIFLISNIFGEINSLPAIIVSVILLVSFVILTLGPSRETTVSSEKQRQGVLVTFVGLISLTTFSIINIPVRASQIVASQTEFIIPIRTASNFGTTFMEVTVPTLSLIL